MTKNLQGTVYLVPLPIGPDSAMHYHTPYLLELVPTIQVWIAENARTLRRYLSSLKLGIAIDSLNIFESNQHTPAKELDEFLSKIKNGTAVGVASEAGIPCIADPGNRVVDWAHRKNIPVIPLIGPNSISMAIESSGMNGQQFIFHGYPPIPAADQKKWLLDLFIGPWQSYTHSFIETPYRTDKLFNFIVATLPDYVLLCMAANLHDPDQQILTKSIGAWKKTKITWGKVPVVYVLGKQTQ
jgi:16S rRNA (cytidine1402-2'-O)-methyltransferase